MLGYVSTLSSSPMSFTMPILRSRSDRLFDYLIRLESSNLFLSIRQYARKDLQPLRIQHKICKIRL